MSSPWAPAPAVESTECAPVGGSSPPWFLIGAILASTLLRFPGLLWPLSSDEAGFTLVGRGVAPSADSLYGAYWVDRSPVLVETFALFDVLAGDYGMRVFAVVANAVIVWAAYTISHRLAGRFAARLATVALVALLANPDFDAWMGKGEVFGTALVAVSIVCSLRAMDARGDRSPQVWLGGFLAGLTAALAVGMKQSLMGGFVFGAALVIGSLARRRITADRARRFVVPALIGALVPVALTVAWVALTPASLGALWYQTVGFRADASVVLASGYRDAPSARAHELWELARTSWLIPTMVVWIACLPWIVKRVPVEAVALFALVVVDIVGVVLGGSYWHAYLIPLLFDAALAMSLVVAVAGWRRMLGVALVAAISWTSVGALWDFARTRVDGEVSPVAYSAGVGIRQVAGPTDTIISLYGSAEVVYASGLGSPYEHLWSLPIRTLDPRLSELKAVLRGDEAPTWIVASVPLNSWDIDHDHSLRTIIARRYEVVERDCGETIYHLRGITPTVDIGCHATVAVWS